MIMMSIFKVRYVANWGYMFDCDLYCWHDARFVVLVLLRFCLLWNMYRRRGLGYWACGGYDD